MVEHRNAGNASGAEGQDSGAGGERVAKALARSGVASRREIERLIAEGRVALNGKVLDTPAVKVAPGDLLTVDGKAVEAAEPTRLWRYHKPVGLLTTHNDPQGRPTVFENLPAGMPRVISVGRLDLASEGLLLLTNDGELARSLELPSSGWVRRYRARARGRITQEKLDRLKDGVTVEGVAYGPIEAKLDKAKEGPQGANLWITVAITEGKNREVRRVLDHLGLKVNRLIRLAYGPFSLGTLGVGEAEEVGPRVIREQLADYVAPENLPTGNKVQAGGGGAAKTRRQSAKSAVPVEKRALPRPSAPRSRPRGSAAPFAARPEGRGLTERPKAPRKGAAGRPDRRDDAGPPRERRGAAKPGPRADRAEKPARGFGPRAERPERAPRPERSEAPRAKPPRERTPFGSRERTEAEPERAGYGARAAKPAAGGFGKRAPAPEGRSADRPATAKGSGYGARREAAADTGGGYGARAPKPKGGYGERPAAAGPRRAARPDDRADAPAKKEHKPGWAKAKPRPPAKGRGPAKPGARPPRKPR